MEALEQARELVGWHADAGVDDRELGAIASPVQAHLDAPLEGVLERVGDQVQHDSLRHLSIDVEGLGQGRAADDEREAGLLGGRAKDAGQLGGLGGQVDRLVGRLHAAGLDARELEEAIHELQQAEGVPVRGLEAPPAVER